MYPTDSRISQCLKDAINDERTSVVQLAKIAGYAPSTVFDWVAGNARIPNDAVASWLRWVKLDFSLFVCLLDCMTGGRAMPKSRAVDPDLNGDGKVDADDEVMATAHVIERSAGDLARHICDARKRKTGTSHLTLLHLGNAIKGSVDVLLEVSGARAEFEDHKPARFPRAANA